MDREKVAFDRFSCTDRERCVFEAGIKMGTIYHQFVGTPVNLQSVRALEASIQQSIKVQPYVKDVHISIDLSSFPSESDMYSYVSLTGDMIDAVVTVEMNGVRVVAEMRYDPELDYPLMFVSDIVG